MTDQERADREVSEAALDRWLMYRVKKYGWTAVHLTAHMVAIAKDGSPVYATDEKGFPDRMLFKPGRMPIFVELKKQLGIVTEEQWEWLDLLIACGQYACVWRPSDRPLIEQVLRGDDVRAKAS